MRRGGGQQSENTSAPAKTVTGPLIPLWRERPYELRRLSFRQIVNMAGDGRLLDNTPCSVELRTLLSEVEADDLERFVSECLERDPSGSARKSFPDSGFVLQDVVNEIGRRLDFSVVNGIYQGRRGTTGFDGIWQDGAGTDLVIEVKTTDTYTISLDQIDRYRQELIEAGRVAETSSVLFVVGREDTGALEAQIRGSKHAWTMRMIGAASLVRLLQVKVNAESSVVVSRIKSLLRPIEYTRVDGIVDLMFDVRADSDDPTRIEEIAAVEVMEAKLDAPARHRSSPPTDGIEATRQIAADRLSDQLRIRLTRRRRSLFETADEDIRAVISVSKRYDREYQSYWYGYYDSQRTYLSEAKSGYLVLCALDSGRFWSVPFGVVESLVPSMNLTDRLDGNIYRHVLTKMVGEDCVLVAGERQLSLAPFEISRSVT